MNPNHDPKNGEFTDAGGGGPKESHARMDAMTDQAHKDLQAHLGKDTFWAAYKHHTENMKPQQAKDLAKRFTGQRTTSRKQALFKIASRQKQLEMAQAKLRATAGRSAA